MASWNPWHGCHKVSTGCLNCYVYRIDGRHGRDASQVVKTKNFSMPIRRKRDGSYKIPSGTAVFTCFSSDFFVPEADAWRPEAWRMIKERSDLRFMFITKRIDRFYVGLPDDWGNGYDHVYVCCTVENQKMADYRLPLFANAPIKHKAIVCEPLLSAIDLSAYLSDISMVAVGGESGTATRPCDFDWVLSIRRQCVAQHVPFVFRQTGARLIKNGKLYTIPRRLQFSQARKANINTGRINDFAGF